MNHQLPMVKTEIYPPGTLIRLPGFDFGPRNNIGLVIGSFVPHYFTYSETPLEYYMLTVLVMNEIHEMNWPYIRTNCKVLSKLGEDSK